MLKRQFVINYLLSYICIRWKCIIISENSSNIYSIGSEPHSQIRWKRFPFNYYLPLIKLAPYSIESWWYIPKVTGIILNEIHFTMGPVDIVVVLLHQICCDSKTDWMYFDDINIPNKVIATYLDNVWLRGKYFPKEINYLRTLEKNYLFHSSVITACIMFCTYW